MLTRQKGDLNSSGEMVTPSTTQEYILDGLGNWKTHKKDAATYSQTINSLNQYEVFNGPAGTRTIQYDFTGNLINEIASTTQQQYTYDFLNRLTICVNYASNTTTYRYDALGRRVAKDSQGSQHTHYVYDGDRLIQERDGSNALVMSYVYGLGSDEVLTRRWLSPAGPFNHFYHTNALGSVTALTDSSGSVVERYKYDAY